ncbi:MAG: alpha/beta hydrolase [Gammaproteobacteria bacterium]|nr:alpha/beta hydrolase [Gammaproteobacteria bacterium]
MPWRIALHFFVLPLLLQTGCSSKQAEPVAIPSPPGTLSQSARQFYANNPVPVVGVDLTDLQTVKSVRAEIDVAWRSGLTKLNLAPIESFGDYSGVTVNRIRFPNTVDDGRMIMYLHGGGFVVGSATANIVLPARVAHISQMPVISVDYRMPPEHPFPAALDDTIGVIRQLIDSGQDPQKLILFGDSAGGGLVLSVALQMKSLGMPMPAGLIVISPWADLTNSGDTGLTLNDFDPVITWPDTLASAATAYAGDHDPANPLISPAFGNYTGLPPLLVQAGSREVLLSDALRVARAARGAGVLVQIDVWDGMWHVFQEHPGAVEAEEAIAEIAIFAKRVTER